MMRLFGKRYSLWGIEDIISTISSVDGVVRSLSVWDGAGRSNESKSTDKQITF